MNFNELKRKVSIVAVLKDKGLLCGLKKRGSDLVGPCPVHKGDNPSAFVLCTEKNLWYCFTRCNGGGDVIELVRKLERVSYYQAAQCIKD
jgi:DNA primase